MARPELFLDRPSLQEFHAWTDSKLGPAPAQIAKLTEPGKLDEPIMNMLNGPKPDELGEPNWYRLNWNDDNRPNLTGFMSRTY